MSDVYQTITVVAGVTYTISYDVYAEHADVNTEGRELCTTTDQNGVLAINDGHMNGHDINSQHGTFHLCPSVAASWTTVSGQYTAQSNLLTLRLHGESSWAAYFDEITVVELLYDGGKHMIDN